MTTPAITWRDRADRRIGRCPTCDDYTWRGRCPGCEQHRYDVEQHSRTRERRTPKERP
jgi:hypothetical protein